MSDEEKKEETKVEEAASDASTEDAGDQKKEVPEKFKSLVEEIEKLSALELSELVKVLEDHFGVSAAAPVAFAGGPAASGGAEAGGEEKSDYTVELAEVGGNKIAVIKAVREITGLGLKEAKDLVDGAPKPVKEGVAQKDAEEMKAKLEEAGAKVNLK